MSHDDLTDKERKCLVRAPTEWAKLDEPDRETLRQLQRKNLVEVKTYPIELRGGEEYVRNEWRLSALGQKVLGAQQPTNGR